MKLKSDYRFRIVAVKVRVDLITRREFPDQVDDTVFGYSRIDLVLQETITTSRLTPGHGFE